jgi:hypothetical protein
LVRFVQCLELELQLLLSALGKYDLASLSPDDLWFPTVPEHKDDQL